MTLERLGSHLAQAAALSILLIALATPGSAQGLSGKLDGTVLDATGSALAAAEITLVGTAYRALTDARGYFFLNAVPAATYTLRVQRDGYAVVEVSDVRIHADVTRTIRIQLPAVTAAAAPGAVQAIALPEPLVTRDRAASRAIITPEQLRDLPVTDPQGVVALQPGVVVSSRAGVQIRGSIGDAVYIDGVPVRNGQRGGSSLVLGLTGLEEATVTTGALNPVYGDAHSGVISYVTATGTQHFAGSVSYRTDDPGAQLWRSVGLHRLEASLGGPVRGHLTFFTSLTLTGQQSLETEKNRDTEAPIFVTDGVDTIVRQPATVGDPTSDTTDVAIPHFVQYSGYCDAARNAGADCQGLRVPLSVNGSAAWQGKLQYTFGNTAHLSLTGLASRTQQRDFPGTNLYNPDDYAATRVQSLAAILNWTQTLSHSGDRALALDVRLSYQSDQRISGILTRQSDLDSRDPFGGFLLKPLDFVVGFDTRHSVQIAGTTYPNVSYLDDLQIRCIVVGEGECIDNVPHLNDNSLTSIMPYRMNPYAVEQSSLSPFWTAGQDGPIGLAREQRWYGLVGLDWQLGRIHRVAIGGELHHYDARRYQATMNSDFQIDAYHEQPIAEAFYAQDRVDLGALVMGGGIRVDRFDSRALYPETPGRLQYPGPFDPLNPTAHFVRAKSHTAVSPRLQIAYALGERTIARASYGVEVQAPDFDLLFQGKNTDLSITSADQIFGRDAGFAKSIIAELGVEHAVSTRLVLDAAVYDRDRAADLVARIAQLPDPAKPGPPGVFNTSDFIILTNANTGHVRGVDVQLTSKGSGVLSGSLAYSFQTASLQPEGPKHAIVGFATVQGPGHTSFAASVRFTSGLRYTRVRPAGAGFTTADGLGTPIEPLGASALPWTKTVDLRVTRDVRLGRFDGSLFAESINLLNFTNRLDLYTETGGVVNTDYEGRFLLEQSSLLLAEASTAGVLTSDPRTGRPAVDLSHPGVCAGWAGRNAGGYASGPVDCVLLQRAERRFGNGDGVFTEAEYTAAFTAWFDFANAPYRFAGPGRRIRVGLQLNF